MNIIDVSLFHNEKHLYDKYINGLYGDSGFKLSDRGYILNRNNDAENSKYLKENTPDNFEIVDRNYDLFRFDVSRNDIYFYADDKESKLNEEDIIYIMPSIDHFTTNSNWTKTVLDKANKIDSDDGFSITTDDINKYHIENTTEIPDPIKLFRKRTENYYVNLPISEDYMSTITHRPMYEYNQYHKGCSDFIHVHYVVNNPNMNGDYYRIHMYPMVFQEVETCIDEYDIYEIDFLINLICVNCYYAVITDIALMPVNLVKKFFMFCLKARKKLLSTLNDAVYAKNKKFLYRFDSSLKKINYIMCMTYYKIQRYQGSDISEEVKQKMIDITPDFLKNDFEELKKRLDYYF